MFSLLVAILVRLRLIKMPGDILVEEASLVEEVVEPGPARLDATSSVGSVSTLLILKAPSTSVVLLYPVSCLVALCPLHSCLWRWGSAAVQSEHQLF